MNLLIETVMVVLVLTNLAMLGTSRLATCIRAAAVQGAVLGALPLFSHPEGVPLRMIVLAVVGVALKAGVFPWMLLRALRRANIRREIEPFVGYSASILIGLMGLALSIWIGSRIALPGRPVSPLVFPVALSTILSGLLLIVSRRKAITQALGYLVMENGIFAFGVVLVGEVPLVVELGVLLDAFVAVLVMGIAIHHISREFDHIDVDELAALKG